VYAGLRLNADQTCKIGYLQTVLMPRNPRLSGFFTDDLPAVAVETRQDLRPFGAGGVERRWVETQQGQRRRRNLRRLHARHEGLAIDTNRQPGARRRVTADRVNLTSFQGL
jgi:hypothetical protein